MAGAGLTSPGPTSRLWLALDRMVPRMVVWIAPDLKSQKVCCVYRRSYREDQDGVLSVSFCCTSQSGQRQLMTQNAMASRRDSVMTSAKSKCKIHVATYRNRRSFWKTTWRSPPRSSGRQLIQLEHAGAVRLHERATTFFG